MGCMTESVNNASSRKYEPSEDGCDESSGVCGAVKPTADVSHPGDIEEFYPPPPKVDAAKNAEIARNMSAASTSPKLDELSWTALRKNIAELETSKSDPAQLATYKRELERRQGIAAEARNSSPVSHWGSAATGQVDKANGVASGNASLVTNSHQTVQIGNVGGAVGANNEVNAAVARVSVPTTAGRTTVEVGSGKVSIGALNADGSKGLHVAAQANVVAIEHTEQTKEGASATGGLSLGTGFELSFGFKGDGICMRVGAGPLTLGGCTTAPGTPASWGDDGSKR